MRRRRSSGSVSAPQSGRSGQWFWPWRGPQQPEAQPGKEEEERLRKERVWLQFVLHAFIVRKSELWNIIGCLEADRCSIETAPRSVISLTLVNYPVYLAIMIRNVNDLLKTHCISKPRKLESDNSCLERARSHKKSDIKQNSIYLTALPNKQKWN